jgi:hypothetical protein
LWYGESNAVENAIGYAMHSSRSHDAVIRVYDEAGNVIETHKHKGDFKEWQGRYRFLKRHRILEGGHCRGWHFSDGFESDARLVIGCPHHL